MAPGGGDKNSSSEDILAPGGDKKASAGEILAPGGGDSGLLAPSKPDTGVLDSPAQSGYSLLGGSLPLDNAAKKEAEAPRRALA